MVKLLLLFLGINILQSFVSGCSVLTYKHEVHIIRDLPPGASPLKLHCASKTNDLGYHILSTNQDFHWNFCENIVPNTLFFCHFWWESKEIAFEVFNAKWTGQTKSKYYWVIKSDGIYYYDDFAQKSEIKRYDWKNLK
ncbi:hypothetical protein CDL12_22722 [Handroanthus impetiginosus]|uniref:S-protein homolog n=1 Tax=Handroanthus impetiginosus TaxID=429701 RepID=A0A2G9GHH4_9LAMI|nr:hypothetical protein CDL12_22722 [Handroanthus impetiginosus]